MGKKLVFSLLTAVLLCSLLLVAPACAPAKGKITLKIISEQPLTYRPYTIFKEWLDRVNASAPDRLHLDYLGGPETIPTFEQMEALMKGVVDMAIIAPVFYTGLLPEGMAIQCMGFTAPVPELRKSGMIALQDEIHRAKLGVTVLSTLWSGDYHGIALIKRVDKADLTGLKIRAIPVQQPAVKMLGGTVATIPAEETYTALQTGLVDGLAIPWIYMSDFKYEEVTNYVFVPNIPISCATMLQANAEVWDALPEDVKNIILDIALELEPKVFPAAREEVQKMMDYLIDFGLEKCGATSPAEEQELFKKMSKVQWKEFIEDRADPTWLPRLSEIAKPVLGIE